MTHSILAIFLGLYADIFAPTLGTIETVSVWCESHPLAMWAAGIITLCVLFVRLNEVDLSEEGAPL